VWFKRIRRKLNNARAHQLLLRLSVLFVSCIPSSLKNDSSNCVLRQLIRGMDEGGFLAFGEGVHGGCAHL
jgi:hypothetical protein